MDDRPGGGGRGGRAGGLVHPRRAGLLPLRGAPDDRDAGWNAGRVGENGTDCRLAVWGIPAAVRTRLRPAAGGGGGFGGDGEEEDLTRHPITTVHYLALSAALLLIGTVGVLTRRNIVIVLMSIELILNAVNINLIAFSHALQNIN